MKTIKIVLSFILTFFFHFLSQGQTPRNEISATEIKGEEKQLLKSARKEFDYGNYDLAAEKYDQLLKLDSANPTYNFEQAQTLYSNFRQPQAIPYFERAIKFSKDSIGEAYYLLGTSYHLAGQFDLAQKNYKIYQSLLNIHGTDLTKEEEVDLKNDVSHRIELCANGKILYLSTPANKFTLNGKTHSFQITSVGNAVNSDYDDYGAVLSSNDSVLYFTSRREGISGDKVDWDDKFFEDIYASNLSKSGWEKSSNIGSPINTKMHEAIISLSPDGETIYFYRGRKQGTFYYSTLKGNIWSTPAILFQEPGLNTGSSGTSFLSYTVFGSELYVVSSRDTGNTGRDIYLSRKKSDGSWGALTNLGTPINTKYDEDAPFITSDGNTMYFSSKGHNSMGGFDIFKSDRKGDKWSEPVNLGVPFNTPGDDIYFIIANKSDRAYYSSSSLASDKTKDMDIYMIDLCDDIPEMILAGVTFGIPNGIVSVSEKASSQKVGDFNIENGKYTIPLKHGVNYIFTLKVSSVIEPVSFDISAPAMCKVYNLYQEIEFPKSAQSIVIRNAFFDIKKEAGIANYSEFLSKIDKSKMPLYSEIEIPISIVFAKNETAKTSTITVGTATVTSSGATSATVAGTHSVTTSGILTNTTVATNSVTASGATTTATTTVKGTTTAIATTTTTTATGTSSTLTTISVNNILFDYDKSNMRSEFMSDLDKVVEFLKNTKSAKIEVAGYTDAKGSDEYNLSLSKRRANAVAVYLASKGISKNRVKAVGYGESKSIAPNENPDGSDNPEGRAKNRRTEITVIH